MKELLYRVQKARFYSTLKIIKAGLGKSKKAQASIAELTFKDNQIEISTPGAKFNVYAEGYRPAKATLPFLYLFELIEGAPTEVLTISLKRGALQINNTEVGVKTTFIDDDKILRSIGLPLNYSDKDLLNLKNGRYTIEELEFNGLVDKIAETERNLKKNIEKAYESLKLYGITKTEIEDIVNKHIGLK